MAALRVPGTLEMAGAKPLERGCFGALSGAPLALPGSRAGPPHCLGGHALQLATEGVKVRAKDHTVPHSFCFRVPSNERLLGASGSAAAVWRCTSASARHPPGSAAFSHARVDQLPRLQA